MTTAPLARHLRRNAAAYGALALGLVLTAAVLAWLQASLVERRTRRFEEAVREGQVALEQRMDLYLAMLLGARGLFWGSAEVTASEFRGYVDSLEVGLRYPGIQGIGWTAWLLPEQVAGFEGQVRADGGPPDFRVWPTGARGAYTAITFLEPLDARNRRAIGYDMYSEPVRREAMGRAMLTGQPAMSGTVRLVQEGQGPPQNGFLVYVPVYRTRGTPTTPEARRAQLRGWVYAPFRVGDLLRGVLPSGLESRMSLHIYQGEGVRPGALLYGPSPLPSPGVRDLHAEVPLQVAGATWTLAFAARDAFLDPSERLAPLYALAGGLLLSVLLFFIIRAEVNARAQAERASRVHARLAERAQAAVRVRDDFLSVAAHELKTPLTSLSLQLQLLKRAAETDGAQDAAGARERLLRACDGAERQAGRLGTLVDRLLDLSRVTSGRLALELEDLDLTRLVHELVQHFEPEAARAGVSLEVAAPAVLPVRSDRLRLEQVLSNLVSNALKYGPGQPVSVRVLPLGEDAVSVEVQDRGIGIAPADAARVFERFERAVSSRHYGGLGLGLYITRQTVEALGGHIELSSTPGEGSTFRVLLPRTGPALELRPPTAPTAAPSGGAPH